MEQHKCPKDNCPLACGMCRLCTGHPAIEAYRRLYSPSVSPSIGPREPAANVRRPLKLEPYRRLQARTVRSEGHGTSQDMAAWLGGSNGAEGGRMKGAAGGSGTGAPRGAEPRGDGTANVAGMAPTPVDSCGSIGVWRRATVQDETQAGAMSNGTSTAVAATSEGQEWWEWRWIWQPACPPRADGTSPAPDEAWSGPPPQQWGGPPPQHDQWGGKRRGSIRHHSLFDATDFLLARRLNSVHFVGESHLALMADCFAASHEKAEHLVTAAWDATYLHRMETPPAKHPYDGYFAEQSEQRAKAARAARAAQAGRAAPAAAGSVDSADGIEVWANCSARPFGCWRDRWNATLNDYAEEGSQLGVRTFARRCWAWKESVRVRLVEKGRMPPEVCVCACARVCVCARE